MVLLDAGQVAERLVFRLELVVVGQLAAQLGVFSPQGLVFRHGLVDAGVLVPDRGHPPGHPGGRFLERGRRHAQQLLGGCGQAAVGRGIQQQPCKKDRHRDQDPEFPGLKKVFHGRSPPLDEKHRVEKARTAGAIRASVLRLCRRLWDMRRRPAFTCGPRRCPARRAARPHGPAPRRRRWPHSPGVLGHMGRRCRSRSGSAYPGPAAGRRRRSG